MPKTHFNRVTHYIPPGEGFLPIKHEFVEPTESDSFIWFLFRFRCMECKQPGSEINEIVPRARSKNSIHDWKNRVVLCRTCHAKFHMNGVTDEKINKMRINRVEFLSSIGRAEYI